MGSCVSNHNNKATNEMKKVQVMFDDTNNIKPFDDHHKVVIYPSSMNDGHVAVKPQLPPSQSRATFSDYGSKEESFFDSQAWLDSDYEDEFMSVNGEFTPSRGNTPVHSSLTLGTTRVEEGATTHPSPTPTEKKRLLDLFKESLRDKPDPTLEIGEPPKKDGEMGLNKDGLKPKSGCFLSLLSARSSGRQKKKNPGLKPESRPQPTCWMIT